MKKLPYSVIIFGFVDILFFFPIIWLIALVLCGISFVYTPPFDLSLSFKNAPENTAYIDLLVEMDTTDGRPHYISGLLSCSEREKLSAIL